MIGDAGALRAARRRRARLMPRTVAARELAIVVSRPRALAIKAGLPLALAVILVAGHAPTFWAGMLLTVLAAMVGAVGHGGDRQPGEGGRLPDTPGSNTGIAAAAARRLGARRRRGRRRPAPPRGDRRPGDRWRRRRRARRPDRRARRDAGGDQRARLRWSRWPPPAPPRCSSTSWCSSLRSCTSAASSPGCLPRGWRAVVAAVDPFSHLHSAFIAVLGGTATYPGAVDVLAAGGRGAGGGRRAGDAEHARPGT